MTALRRVAIGATAIAILILWSYITRDWPWWIP
jgi:hypothetical protein